MFSGPGFAAELPPGVVLEGELSRGDDGVVLAVSRGKERLVLRVGAVAASPPLELCLADRLSHPSLVMPRQWGRLPSGRPYLLRPFVEGQPFDEAVQAATPEQLNAWVCQLLEGLAALHDAGLVHRDIKAANVIVGAEGPVLVDLDLLARRAAAGGAGSAHHMAPEVLLGHPATPSTDLFSLGVMLALASGRGVSPDFHRQFPRVSFWSAAGIDSADVPGELGALVRQLVRRHPADRPASAREAWRRLGGTTPAPELELPFLAGREAAVQHLASELRPVAGERWAALILVDDVEEAEPLIEQLELTLAIEGHSFGRPVLGEALARAVDELVALPTDGVLVNGMAVVDQHGVAAATDVLVAFLASPDRRGASLGLVVSPGLARQLTSLFQRRRLEQEAGDIKVVAWPRVPVGVLASHLDQLSEGSSPDVAQALALSLHERTDGRLTDVNRCLSSARDVGVLRTDDAGTILLRSEWPGGQATEDELDVDPQAWGQPAVRALAVLSVAMCPLSPSQLGALGDLDPTSLASALSVLRARGVLRPERGRDQLELGDRRWLGAARRRLTDDDARRLHRRALEVLGTGSSTPTAALASHRLALATTDAEVAAVLDVADDLVSAAQTSPARRLFQRLEARRASLSPELVERLTVLEARLELAQGDAVRALRRLHETLGESLDQASCALLLVAAHAAEQAGRREQARELNRRVLAAEPSREERLRATVGVAYADYLDGDAEGVLDRTADAWQTGDPPEAVASLLNVRGVALLRLGRQRPAADELERARKLAADASQPLLEARIALNLAVLDRRRGRPSAAVERLEQAAEAFSQAGHVQGRALALHNLGVLQRDRGELAQARDLLGQALALRRRVGDVHGAASSLGSLAILELEAGHVGASLETLERARLLFWEGEYDTEVAFLDVQRAVALSLTGRHGEAASMLSEEGVERTRSEHPALVRRAEACLHLAADQRPRALAALREGIELARAAKDAAELFRSGAVFLGLMPGDADAVAAVEEAADELQSPVRAAEAAWRGLVDSAPADRAQLEDWLQTFEAAGRTDLVRAVARTLAEVCDRSGDRAARRAAAARAAEAADALTDGLLQGDREATLERLSRLSGPLPARELRGASLGIDWLLSCNRRMATEENLDGLLLSIVDMALEVTGSQRGFLVLLEDGSVSVQVARHMDRQSLPEEETSFSRSVVQEVVQTRQPVLTTDAAADARFAGARSIASLELRCVLCVPVVSADGVVGALYLDNDSTRVTLDDTDVERVRALADQASVAIFDQRRRVEIEGLNRRLAERVEYQEQELAETRSALRRKGGVAPVGGLVGVSEAMTVVYGLIDRVAPTELSVLVTGPSGTGKDLVARALHERSQRAAGPLIIENVAAVPASLLESELFGHLRGAFTGADRDRPGLFAEADGGTFVLDEIGEMPLELQPKLLRVLETGEIRPVGSRRVTRVDVRIVAATNQDLAERVRSGKFREDLYYRLNGIEIRMPPLAERLDDVPLLAEHFLSRLNEKHGTTKDFRESVMSALVRRSWPGQVRELANEVSRLYFLSDDEILDPGMVRPPAANGAQSVDPMPASLLLEDVERAAIVRALRAAGQRKDQAARLLGISRAGLYTKINRLGLGLDARAG